MTSGHITIHGPDGAPYALGQAMYIYHGDVLLGTLDPVPLRKNGTEIHIESFTPGSAVRQERRHIGRLIFLEICAFVVANFPQVQAISFALSRRVDLLGGGAQQAAARSETMSRIGALDVRVVPKADELPGHFVVSGVWTYNERNLRALHDMLEHERTLYNEAPVGTQRRPTGFMHRLRRTVARRICSRVMRRRS